MKRLLSLFLCVLLCFGCLVPAFAEEDAEPATTAAEETTSAESEAPELPEAYLKWAHGGQYDDRGAFDRAFRRRASGFVRNLPSGRSSWRLLTKWNRLSASSARTWKTRLTV